MRVLQLASLFGVAILLPERNEGWVPAVPQKKTRTSALYSTEPPLSSTPPGVYTLDGEDIRGPITPVSNFILVKVKDTLTATEGGILLPDESKDRPTEGLVMAAGPGRVHPFTAVRITNPIEKGMSVLYGDFDGKAITYNDDACQMIRDDNVLLSYEGVTMNINNVNPIRDWVLIELDEDPETLSTSSGVVVANQVVAEDVPCEGVVVKVGEGRMNSKGEFSPSPVAPGDRVKFRDYAGNEIRIDGKEYSVVKMVNILSTSTSGAD